MSSSQDKPKIYKIYFIIQKKVDYGDAIYVPGNIPELGKWNLTDSLRLTWNKVNHFLKIGSLLDWVSYSLEPNNWFYYRI